MSVERPSVAYTSRTGRSIAYQVIGDSGPPVVYMHTWFSNLDAEWDDPANARWLRRFGASCRLILIDKSGCGLSDRVVPSPDAALDVWSDEVVAVLDELGISRSALLVSSWSGPLGLHVAARHPDRIERLVLLGTFARLGADDDRDLNPGMLSRELISAARDRLIEGWGTGVLVETLGIDPGRYGRERLARYERAAASRDDVVALSAYLVDADSRELLPRIQCETLVVHMENPIFERAHAEYLHERLPNSTLVAHDRGRWRWAEPDDDVGMAHPLAVLEFLTGTADEPETASRLMIVMFVDIVGSTGIAARLGDREWVDTLKAFTGEVEQRLLQYRGRIVNDTGDGFIAVLPTVRAALQLALDTAAIGERLGTPVRVGVHAGDCHIQGDELRGLAVHAAARLLDVAERGDVIVTSPIVALAPAGTEFEPFGEHELRGVPGRFALYRVLS